MKEQIEEMAKHCPCYFGEKCCIDGEFPEKCDMLCQFGTYAEILYNEGYRKQEWISVEERLPDNYRPVLVVCESTSISGGTLRAIGSFGGGFWSLAYDDGTMYLTKYMHFVVTHWMELPEPPKMKGGAV